VYRLSAQRIVSTILVLLVGVTNEALAQGSTSLDIQYSEIVPLSTHSLLLDITSLPGGGYVAVGERGHVVTSEDGKEWSQAEVVPTRSTLTGITSVGDRLWAAGHDSVILTSGDKGRTWTRQYFDPDRQQPIMDIHFFDTENGIAIGAYGLALLTSDGGDNWGEGMINEEEWHNNAFLAVDDMNLMVAGEAGFSYRSVDGGETWETLNMPYPGSMFGIIAGENDCLLVFGLRGHVQESCDFGESWEELDTGTESTITGAARRGDRTVMVGNSGLILVRESDGSFTSITHASGVDFAAVVDAGDGKFLLCGEDGIHHYRDTFQ
jgi:photosystem II stability/assembly factor-like uncharacterized protein